LLGDFVKEFDITGRLFYEVWKDLIDSSRGVVKTEPIESKPEGFNPFTNHKTETPAWKI
jgi:hypothetical protein